METLIKADIFFFISSIATIVLAALACVLLFYLIKASRNLYALSETLKAGMLESKEFIIDLKDRLESNVIFRIFFPRPKAKKK